MAPPRRSERRKDGEAPPETEAFQSPTEQSPLLGVARWPVERAITPNEANLVQQDYNAR